MILSVLVSRHVVLGRILRRGCCFRAALSRRTPFHGDVLIHRRNLDCGTNAAGRNSTPLCGGCDVRIPVTPAIEGRCYTITDSSGTDNLPVCTSTTAVTPTPVADGQF